LIDLQEMIQKLAGIDGDAAQLVRVSEHETETQSTLVGRGFVSFEDGWLSRLKISALGVPLRGRGAGGNLTRV